MKLDFAYVAYQKKFKYSFADFIRDEYLDFDIDIDALRNKM